MTRLLALTLTALFTGVACAPSPPGADIEVESFSDSAQLCIDGDELRAVFDTCASSCDTLVEATCTIDAGSITTYYEVEHPSGAMDCTADCRLHDASCGTLDTAGITYGDAALTSADLPACSELF